MSIELVMLSNHLVLCYSLLLMSSIFFSIRGFFRESALQIRWPNTGASASVLPVNIQGWFPLRSPGLIPLLLHLLVNCNYRKQSIQEGGTQRHWKVSVNTFDIFAYLKNKRSWPENILHVAEFVLWSLGPQGRGSSVCVPSIFVRPVSIFNIY